MSNQRKASRLHDFPRISRSRRLRAVRVTSDSTLRCSSVRLSHFGQLIEALSQLSGHLSDTPCARRRSRLDAYFVHDRSVSRWSGAKVSWPSLASLRLAPRKRGRFEPNDAVETRRRNTPPPPPSGRGPGSRKSLTGSILLPPSRRRTDWNLRRMARLPPAFAFGKVANVGDRLAARLYSKSSGTFPESAQNPLRRANAQNDETGSSESCRQARFTRSESLLGPFALVRRARRRSAKTRQTQPMKLRLTWSEAASSVL